MTILYCTCYLDDARFLRMDMVNETNPNAERQCHFLALEISILVIASAFVVLGW